MQPRQHHQRIPQMERVLLVAASPVERRRAIGDGVGERRGFLPDLEPEPFEKGADATVREAESDRELALSDEALSSRGRYLRVGATFHGESVTWPTDITSPELVRR